MNKVTRNPKKLRRLERRQALIDEYKTCMKGLSFNTKDGVVFVDLPVNVTKESINFIRKRLEKMNLSHKFPKNELHLAKSDTPQSRLKELIDEKGIHFVIPPELLKSIRESRQMSFSLHSIKGDENLCK